MSNRRIEMYQYQQIIYRLQQGQKTRAIARDGLASRDKIAKIKEIAENNGWLKLTANLPTEKELEELFSNNPSQKQQSKSLPYSEMIVDWYQQRIQAKVIYQHLKDNYGYTGAYNSIQRFTKKLKEQDISQLTVPLNFSPGEAAQIDFGKGPRLYDERLQQMTDSWFFVMTLCWSRHQYARLIVHQDVETWLDCHQNAFYWFGGVVSKVIIDNPKCAITTACYYDPQVQRSYESFAQEYGFIISACPPREPKKKGRVESGIKFIKRNFLPLRTFSSLQDANRQLQQWVMETAGNRIHGSTFEKPVQQFNDIEQSKLKALPTTPPEIAVWNKAKLYKNCHIRHAKCYYSAPYKLYDKELWIKTTINTVTIYYQYEIVAMHARLFKAGSYSTKNEHLPPKAKYFLERDENWCRAQSKVIGVATHFVIDNLLTNPSKDLLRSAQGIIGLRDDYSADRVEMACKRAIYFNTISYRSIKTILVNKSDCYEVNIINTPAKKVYQGQGSFQRQVMQNI